MPLPELLPDVDAGDPDAQIVYGAVPAELAEPSLVGTRFQPAAGILLLRIEGVVRFLVTGGRSIVVEPNPHALEEGVRLSLLILALSAFSISGTISSSTAVPSASARAVPLS